jgi:hypothetical protein
MEAAGRTILEGALFLRSAMRLLHFLGVGFRGTRNPDLELTMDTSMSLRSYSYQAHVSSSSVSFVQLEEMHESLF